MKEEVLKTFDLFIENADTEELKELIKEIKELYKENERLHSIIKEVREYSRGIIKVFEEIHDKELITNRVVDISVIEKILEMLDKEK